MWVIKRINRWKKGVKRGNISAHTDKCAGTHKET